MTARRARDAYQRNTSPACDVGLRLAHVDGMLAIILEQASREKSTGGEKVRAKDGCRWIALKYTAIRFAITSP
jgi:hypothetical protein